MLLPSQYVRLLRQCSRHPPNGRRWRNPPQLVSRKFAFDQYSSPAKLRIQVGAFKSSASRQPAIRTLFELHAGRQPQQIPSDLLIHESKSVLSNKNEHPRSTSEELIAALGKIGDEYRRPEQYASRTDLSYSDAATAVLDWREASQQAAANLEVGRDEKWGLHPKDVLVDYLRHVVPRIRFQEYSEGIVGRSQMDKALLKVFSRRNDIYFNKRGWSITDLMDWTWILSANTAERAAHRLAYIGQLSKRMTGPHKNVPQFVHIFLLRRTTINAPALRVLLLYTWDYMEWISQNKARAESGESMSQNISEHLCGMEEFKFMLIIIRLLRSARKVMPAACENIVALFCRYLGDSDLQSKPKLGGHRSTEDRSAALAFMYNSMLQLVAVPASLNPFRSATNQQRAQFTILRRMNQFDPPLIVDRRGYRAVARMQLMYKKTAREREWALLKAESWPPWKDSRLGIYADIDPEYGISRAREVLNQAREAGYAADDWDDAASVLSGWDTDDSPTIQTRAILKDTVKNADVRTKNEVWAARITATRTLHEAWAAFLSYEDSGLKRFAVPYAAMFEKLFYDAKRESAIKNSRTNLLQRRNEEQILPGDTPKVYPLPVSPRDAIYVRTAPPSIDQFLQKMINDGIKPRAQGDILVRLLRHAPSLATGVRFLKYSSLPMTSTVALMTRHSNSIHDAETQALVAKIPAKLFNAFIRLLTRFAWKSADAASRARTSELHAATSDSAITEENLQAVVDAINPISQAIWLVHCRKPRERTPWYSVLAALASSRVITPLDSYTKFRSYSAIANWKTSCWLLECMEELDVVLDLAAMKILCTSLERAIFEAESIKRQKTGLGNVAHIPKSDLDLILDKGLPLIKHIFKDIVRSEGMQQEIPQSILDNQDKNNPPLESLLEEDDSVLDVDVNEDIEDANAQPPQSAENYLPPACLLPKLLEIPDPAHLHSFVRVLGLCRDYQGLLDLIEWMALFSDEIRAVTEEQQHGSFMMRRCLTAVRVFLERSWLYYQESGSAQAQLSADVGEVPAAPVEIWQVIHDTIVETQHWGGWPTDEEVERYCARGLFI